MLFGNFDGSQCERLSHASTRYATPQLAAIPLFSDGKHQQHDLVDFVLTIPPSNLSLPFRGRAAFLRHLDNCAGQLERKEMTQVPKAVCLTLVTEREICRRRAISRTTHWRDRQRADYPRPYKVGARGVRFSLEEVFDWVRAQRA